MTTQKNHPAAGQPDSFDRYPVYYGSDLELTYTPQRSVFTLWAPTADKVRLNLYASGEGGEPEERLEMRPSDDGTWRVAAERDLKGTFYTFQIEKEGKWLDETPGIWAKAVGVNGDRAAVIDLRETDPEGWEADRAPELKMYSDIILYELHHRDFSVAPDSGIENKGKFLALTETGTKTPQGEASGLDHLKELGVTHIHILPSFDYATVDEARLNDKTYNWGYDPKNYNVPEGSYSTDPADPAARIREFKQMVQALHQAGIRVVLDVVYNHTFSLEGSNFDRTFPKAYYRYRPDGTPSDGSGCGNETASEKPLMREFMIESMKYWAQEYHIDGFRVDLMGCHDIETMNLLRQQLQQVDPSIFIYGEGWSAGSCAIDPSRLATKAHIRQMPGIAAFSDELRDALRGPFDHDDQGAFLAGLPGFEESIKAGIVGLVAHPQVDYSKVNYTKEPWANEPTQMIAYVSCHDDLCLTDRLRASVPETKFDEEALIRLDLLAQTAVLTSQGVPFLLSGEEMLRTKQGVHNSFKSPDEINHLDWNNLQRYPQVFDYYKGLIHLRLSHPAFRLGSADLVRKHLEFLPTQDCLVAFRLKNHAGGDAWNNIYVILNSSPDFQTVQIPEGDYTIVVANGQADEAGLGDMQGGEVMIDGQSALILHD